jgi:hypothetical protein
MTILTPNVTLAILTPNVTLAILTPINKDTKQHEMDTHTLPIKGTKQYEMATQTLPIKSTPPAWSYGANLHMENKMQQ